MKSRIAYTGLDILAMVVSGKCSWEYLHSIDKGRYRGYVEIEVSNIPGWPEDNTTKIVIPASDYESLMKKKDRSKHLT